MKLALFDLDRTLLPIDSADTWSHFLVQEGGRDAAGYGARIRAFAASYEANRFDVDAYQDFQMELLACFPRAQLEHRRARFIREHVLPHLRPAAVELIDAQRRDGFVAVKVTGTNAFVAARGRSLDDCDDSVFYSDSSNDLPLLERVKRPVATNPDHRLRVVAAERGWPTLEVFAAALAR
jgi:phosphoserine phosphatase